MLAVARQHTRQMARKVTTAAVLMVSLKMTDVKDRRLGYLSSLDSDYFRIDYLGEC